MNIYDSLKKLWKELGINGQVKNYSSRRLWVIETNSGEPIARWLESGFKTPKNSDVDGFKRFDGISVAGHPNWWKIYDFSTAEVFDARHDLKVSVISKTAVDENHFGSPLYQQESWGTPIKLVVDVRREKKRIVAYCVTNVGWIEFDQALQMTCQHEIDNARPVFPLSGRPYIRTRRDKELSNNLVIKGIERT